MFNSRCLLCSVACLAVVAAACSAETPLLEPSGVPPVPVPPVEVSDPLSPPSGESPSPTVEPPDEGSAGELLGEGTGSGAGEGAGGGDKSEDGAGAPPPVAPVVPEGEREEPEVRGPDGGSQGAFVDVSAGLGYSCGLREGGAVECWESGWNGALPDEWWEREIRDSWSGDPADAVPPSGVFTAVSAGWGNACGLRPSGELECWGRNRNEVVSPPSGVFSEVSVGVEHACGVRSGGRLECWGFSGRRRPEGLPPGGVFLDFAVGHDFGCGVRADHSVECWGAGFTTWREALREPEGEFVSVHAEGYDVCGLRVGGSVECWGSFSEDTGSYLLAPSGEFVSILGVHYRTACGLRPGGEVTCWGEGREGKPDSWGIPISEEGSPSPSGGGACGAHFTGRRYCFESGNDADSLEEVSGIVGYDYYRFPVDYTYVGYEYYCGLRPSGEVICGYSGDLEYSHLWEEEVFPTAPAGAFTALKEGPYFFCGLRPSGEVTCWGVGDPDLPFLSPPDGVFTKIDIGLYFACGLRPSGEVTCWGYGGEQSKIIPPNEAFTAVHAGWGGLAVWESSIYESDRDWGLSCGLHTGGGVDCWGEGRRADSSSNTLSDPEGEFTQVGVGKEDFCGLRPSGVIECWGTGPGLTPEGERIVNFLDGDGEGYTALSVGGEFTCGLRRDGAADCWSPDRSISYQKEGPYTTVSAGYAHQCGVLMTGDIHCWESRGANPENWEEITIPASGET